MVTRIVRWVQAVAVAAAATWVFPGWAEEATVYTKDGRRLSGDVTVTDTQVTINTLAGAVVLDRGQVEKIVPRESPQAAYMRKVAALAPGDVEGHYQVAEWASEHRYWDIVVKQCTYVLGLDPKHTKAKLLLEDARRKQAEASGGGARPGAEAPREEEAPPAPGEREPLPLLSARDVQRLKLGELATEGGGEDVRVRFSARRGQPDVLKQFVKEMAGRDGYGESWQRAFGRLKPHEQLREMVSAARSGVDARFELDRYADQIEILDDPAAFANFRKKVMPIVVQGCGRSGCHNATAASEFRLPGGSRSSEPFAYTLFAIMDATPTAYGPLINRERPESSVLLSYMLPLDGNNKPHPEPKRGKFIPAIPGVRARNYEVVVDWINSLRSPRPDYALEYQFPFAPASQPASRAAPGSAPRP